MTDELAARIAEQGDTGMILDLFAGAGGADEGARLAGWDGPLVGIEWDRDACRTAVAAGHWRVQADVATYPTAPFAGKAVGLWASPPCPTWSMAGDGAGKVDLPNVLRLIADYANGREPGGYTWEDERSALTAQPMRWAAALRPRWVACEQVPPVLPVWRYTAELLRKLGYWAWCGILSAERYGVAQTRQRAFLIASLYGPVAPPEPTHQAYKAGVQAQEHDDLFGAPLPPPISMAQALGWCGAVQTHPRGAGMTERHGDRPDREMTDPSFTVTAGTQGSGPRLEWVLRNNSNANACVRGLAEPAGTLFFGKRANAVDWVQERPATTVCGDPRLGAPGHRDRDGGERQFGEQSVRVSVQEAGILQGFPADYPWTGSKSSQYLQAGNAVPPPVTAAILRPLLASSICGVAA